MSFFPAVLLLVSPHGIALPKGLYFTAVVVFFLFCRRLISGVTERISTKTRHIFTYDCCLKNLVRTPLSIYPYGLGAKPRFLATDFELQLNISLQWNMISTVGKKLVNLQRLPYMPPNLVNFGPETAENDWRVFAHP